MEENEYGIPTSDDIFSSLESHNLELDVDKCLDIDEFLCF